MDPNATLELIRQALHNGDKDEARYAADDLNEWIQRGGFLPADSTWQDTVNEALQS